MVKIRTCSFCAKQIEPGRGMTYVRTNGQIFYFCTTKCQKFQIEYKKKPRKQKWTKIAQDIKEKEKERKKS